MKLSDLKKAGVDYIEIWRRLTDDLAGKVTISFKGAFSAKDHPGTRVTISATPVAQFGIDANLGGYPTSELEAFVEFRRQVDLFLANEIDLEALKK